jgi:hypothetical protein
MSIELLLQAAVFHAIDKHCDFERGYYILKLTGRAYDETS